jgi:quercetin dioxygenase-like cupin family protein
LNFNIHRGTIVPLRTECTFAARKEKEAMSTAGTIIRGEGEGERLWFAGGGLWTMKATSEETDGAFSLWEDQMAQGKMTPLHTHPNVDETLIVLEGEILVYAEGKEHRVGPRGVAVALRGAPHAFMVISESALILTLQTPGSGEAFYRDASEPATAETDPARTDFDRVRAAAERHPDLMQILGPPPFEEAREEPARARA